MWPHIPSDPVWARRQMAAGEMMDTLSHNHLTEGSTQRKEWWIFAGDSLPFLCVTFSVTPDMESHRAVNTGATIT